ncbi:IclR family transcriptional regulator [Halocatena salina]|uniref:IclR family transcriptional regulator n=1 Tax=Halocatena salina TaxID=2934340 RepID=A0A8U0A6X6_9EURY|nr:IclR family transcriptional regulator [Halocatena salina]UPM44941.1 IclR family transcriptional regulator [Halocatena salina]
MSDMPQYVVEATGTSLAILEALTEASDPMGVTALSKHAGVAKSVVHNHLSTLRAHGYVVKRGRQYEASLRLLSRGKQVRRSLSIYQNGKKAIDNLAAATDETTALFIREENYAVPVYVTEGNTDWMPPFQAGDRLPLHATASGKCLMASLSNDELETILENADRETFTDTTITGLTKLSAELRRVRDEGIGFCREEYYERIVSVAAPIPSTDGSRTAALSVSGPTDQLNGRYLEEDITGQVLSTTKSIQAALTGN